MNERKPRKYGQSVHRDRIVPMPFWLLEDILIELTQTNGLYCTDRPDIIPQEYERCFWKLNHSRTLHRLVGHMCLEDEKEGD